MDNNRDQLYSYKTQISKYHNQVGSADVQKFLLSLPHLESHYCRSSSTKLYLEPLWNSYRNGYWAYQKKNSGSRKKDQCNTCAGYKNGSIQEEMYQTHN